jgi:class 3 adenylate cyclase/DNA-binding CsgD family transcriptional regulator/DNA-binding transcriptional ArsR family regulator
MTCPVCQHANQDDARFCEQCGQALETVCPACGSRATAEARFCRICGEILSSRSLGASQTSLVQPAPPARTLSLDAKLDQLQRYVPQHLADKILANRGRLEGERKLVTVLFADIAGYTALGAQLGEEALFAIMDELYELFIHEVHRYEGTVNELTGDGIVAFFGAPLAVEQAPQRAVRAALALQAVAVRYESRLAYEADLRLQLRVGLNTGPVIVGTVGNDLRMDYKAVGNTVNLAARMEQTATPGSIQITEHTYKLIVGYFDCDDLGFVSIKGLSGKTHVYRVTGEHGVRARIDVASERGFTRLVGREHELNLLRQCYTQVQDGRGQAVSIIADAGLGKSRLLYEFRQTLADADFTWLDGRCYPYGTAMAYLPIVDLLKQIFQIDTNDSNEDIRRKVHAGLEKLNAEVQTAAPYLLHLLATDGDDSVLAEMSPEAVKHHAFEALRWLVLEMAPQRPLVLAIEDLHWIDKTSAEWITFLLEHIAGSGVMLVCTYRPDFATTWSRKSYHHVISLTRLEHQESVQMLTALLGPPATRIQETLATLVLDRAEGVPFFLEELVKSLQESGAIELVEEQWRLKPGERAVQLPDTVDEVLMARIDRLSEDAKSVLQLGSVIGREFDWELLREIAGLSDQALAVHLAALTDAELLYARGLPPKTTYMFKHAFTQEAAYRSLLTTRRRQWHHLVAVTLEALFPDRLEEYYGQLAYHYIEAAADDDMDKAIEYAGRAGERYMTLPAYTEAVRFYHMALETLHRQAQVDEARHCALQLALGEAQRKAGEHVQALDTLQRAADSARQLAAVEELARAAIEFEQATWGGRVPAEPAVHLLQDALTRLGEADGPLLAKVLGSLARARLFAGDPEHAAADARRAVKLARRAGDPGVLAFNLHTFLHIPWGPEEVEERLADATEMLQLAKVANDEELVGNAHGWRLMCLIEMGDIRAVDDAIAAYVQSVDKLQQPAYFYFITAYRTMRALLAGDFEAAEQLTLHVLTLGQQVEVESVEGIFGLLMFTLRREQGRLKEVEPALKHFMKQHGAAAAWRPGLALIYREFGRQREARREFEVLAQHDFADLPRDTLWVGCMVYLTEVCAFLGDAARAAILYALLRPYAGRAIYSGGAVCYGAASRYLGLLATTMAYWDEAERHFKDAMAMNTGMEARPWLAHTQHDYAAMLLTRNRPGDGDTATALFDEALRTARELGMRALEDRITAHLAPPPPAAVPFDLDDLSPREIDVLHLIAAGKSNREIADALFISLNTVATHVRNILTKTDCANRTEAAAYAMRHGLSET